MESKIEIRNSLICRLIEKTRWFNGLYNARMFVNLKGRQPRIDKIWESGESLRMICIQEIVIIFGVKDSSKRSDETEWNFLRLTHSGDQCGIICLEKSIECGFIISICFQFDILLLIYTDLSFRLPFKSSNRICKYDVNSYSAYVAIFLSQLGWLIPWYNALCYLMKDKFLEYMYLMLEKNLVSSPNSLFSGGSANVLFYCESRSICLIQKKK